MPALQNLCKRLGVKTLYIFGSAVSGKFNTSKSDLDLLVEIDEKDPIERGTRLMELNERLIKLFNREIDLLTTDSIQNPVLRENILRTKQLIYDRERSQILQ